MLFSASPNMRLMAPSSMSVAERRRGAVRVDILDVGRHHLRAFQRGLHGAESAVAVFGGRRHVIGIAREAVAHDFGVDFRAALFRVLVFFKNDDAGRPSPITKPSLPLSNGREAFSGVSL